MCGGREIKMSVFPAKGLVRTGMFFGGGKRSARRGSFGELSFSSRRRLWRAVADATLLVLPQERLFSALEDRPPWRGY